MPPESDACPFLVPIVADRLWMYPTSAYCHSRERVHVPADATIGSVCLGPSHRQCPGYHAAAEKPGAPRQR
jgi:hypothetical protein